MLLLGVVCYDERMQKLSKALHHDDEKETSNGMFEELVE
jgi:hypothetical protein